MPAPPPTRPASADRDVRPAGQWTWPLLGALGLFLVVAAVTVDRTGLLEVGPRPWRALITLPGHGLLLYVLHRYVGVWMPFGSVALNALANFVVLLPLALALAALSYTTIERPFLRLRGVYKS